MRKDQVVERAIRILMLEPDAVAAASVEAALEQASVTFKAKRVTTVRALRQALAAFKPHVILAEYRLPRANALDVLQSLVGSRPSIPFILVTNPQSEQTAVACMKAGAADYVLKSDLQRLPDALRDALAAVEIARAADALQESQERYRAFVAQSSEAIWRFELEQPIPLDRPEDEQIERCYRYAYLAECNDAMARMYGFERAEELVGARLSTLMDRADPRNTEFLRAAIRSGYRVVDVESHETDRDGNSKYFLNTLVCVIEGDKLVRGWGTQRDVTEQKKAEQTLRESEARYRLLFHNNPHPMWLVNIETLKFLDVNTAALSHYGYTRDEFLSMTTQDIRPPEEVPRMREFLAALPPGFHMTPTLFRHRKKDGSLIDVETTGYTFVQSGQRISLVLAYDVTERKRAENALRDSEARFKSAFDNAPIGMALVAPGGRFLRTNQAHCRIVGYSEQELLTMRFQDMLHPDDVQDGVAAHEGVLSGQTDFVQVEKRHVCKDGRVIWCEVSLSPIRDTQGQTRYLIAQIQDVTERRRAERERLALERKLQETQKIESLGVLAGGIAHDFNNLLAAILGNVGLANMQVPKDSPTRPYLASIETAAHRAADLCKQMLAYAGRSRFVVQSVNANTIIQEMANLLRISIGKNVLLKLNLAPSLPLVFADATQMRQVVMNLIINASEAIGDKTGAISLATGVCFADPALLAETYLSPDLPEGEYLFIEVADTGCGMDEQTKPRIFDPFFSTKFTGRGLGLAAVLGIVRAHKGALKVDSAPAAGSTFRVLLPCGKAPEQAARPSSGPKQPKLKGTVIVVDEDETLRPLQGRMLETLGLRPLLAADGHEAIEMLRADSGEVVAVLLHMTLPGLTAEDAYLAMCRIKPDLRAVLMSGYDQREALARFGPAERVRFLQKPFTPQDLYVQLRGLLPQP